MGLLLFWKYESDFRGILLPLIGILSLVVLREVILLCEILPPQGIMNDIELGYTSDLFSKWFINTIKVKESHGADHGRILFSFFYPLNRFVLLKGQRL